MIKPALTMKTLFTLVAVATAVVALPSGPNFTFGGNAVYAKSKIHKKKDDLDKGQIKKIGRQATPNSRTNKPLIGTLAAKTLTHLN